MVLTIIKFSILITILYLLVKLQNSLKVKISQGTLNFCKNIDCTVIKCFRNNKTFIEIWNISFIDYIRLKSASIMNSLPPHFFVSLCQVRFSSVSLEFESKWNIPYRILFLDTYHMFKIIWYTHKLFCKISTEYNWSWLFITQNGKAVKIFSATAAEFVQLIRIRSNSL